MKSNALRFVGRVFAITLVAAVVIDYVAVRCMASESRPNVLIILVDDLNDWVGCLGGHPQVQTPHIDRLANRGILFTNAHVQATFCGPSRISLLSGRMPQSTGCRNFEPYESLETLNGHAPFPLHFRREGYETFGGGKIFHHGTGKGWVAESWTNILPSGINPRPKERMNWGKPVWDWGAWPKADQSMGDYQLAQSTAKLLRAEHAKPFFAVAGFRRPHVPLHVPPKWFHQYPVDEIILPDSPSDDLDDVPHPEMGTNNYAAPKHSRIVREGKWRSLVQAYLASISFVDHCVGEILSGLDEGPHGNSTLVVFTSDHGFHLGEKQHWAKRTLWEETTRVPLIVAGPKIQPGEICQKPVGLIDLYPTLCELTNTQPPTGLEGQSLKRLLMNPDAEWDSVAYTTFQPGDVSVRTEHWRYIRHPDNSEELYDHRVDANEWTNLAKRAEQVAALSAVKQELAAAADVWDKD